MFININHDWPLNPHKIFFLIHSHSTLYFYLPLVLAEKGLAKGVSSLGRARVVIFLLRVLISLVRGAPSLVSGAPSLRAPSLEGGPPSLEMRALSSSIGSSATHSPAAGADLGWLTVTVSRNRFRTKSATRKALLACNLLISMHFKYSL